MFKSHKIILVGILVLTVEKMLQHLLTAVFFIVDISSIGRPDIGTTFQFNDATMVVFNLIVFILFGLSLWGRVQGKHCYRSLLIGLAVFDILAEFIFHGIFFITISVIVSTFLLVLIKLDVDKSKRGEGHEHKV